VLEQARKSGEMEDLVLYCAATGAMRLANLAVFGRPQRRLEQQVRNAGMQPRTLVPARCMTFDKR